MTTRMHGTPKVMATYEVTATVTITQSVVIQQSDDPAADAKLALLRAGRRLTQALRGQGLKVDEVLYSRTRT